MVEMHAEENILFSRLGIEIFTRLKGAMMPSEGNGPQPVVIQTVVDHKKGSHLPQYGSKEASGADLHACLEKDLVLLPGERKLVSTGLQFAIPPGYEIQIRPRSGWALHEGITVLNTPGTIDADYRGTVGVILFNASNQPVTISPGMRIAQAVVTPVCRANFVQQEELSTTTRGEGCFGHTGIY